MTSPPGENGRVVAVGLRFSPVVVLPSPFARLNWKHAIVFVLLLPVVFIAGNWLVSNLSTRWMYFRWGFSEYLVLGGLLIPIGIGLVTVARWQMTRRVKELFGDWLRRESRSDAERAAAAFYLALLRPGRKRRAAAVASFLNATPSVAGRVIQIGGGPISPCDDGTLWEECDVLEGRTRGVNRWLIVALCVPMVVQLSGVIAMGGTNPLHWSGKTVLMGLGVFANAAVILVAAGYVRTPGTVVLASPNSIKHSSLRGAYEFTVDDSVVVLSGVGRTRGLVVFRRDGQRAIVQFPGAAAVGLQNLINRWCMAIPTQVQTPATATRIGS